MSTEDCKNFIKSISETNGFSGKEKWKRTRKYKQDSKDYRDFQNEFGDTIVLAESHDGTIELISIKKNQQLSSEFKNKFTKEKLFIELFKLYGAINYLHETMDMGENIVELEVSNKNAIKAYQFFINNKDESKLKECMLNYQCMYNENEIHELYEIGTFLTETGENEQNLLFKNNFILDTDSKAVGVIYDKENIIPTYVEKEGISYFMLECGGDWESPVLFFVYWSEKSNRLKGFFPKGDGNVYNVELNTAYGSEQESPKYNENKAEKYEKQYEYVQDNFEHIYKKAKEKGFQQFKDFLINNES